MTVPDFQSMLLPLLRVFADGQAHTIGEMLENLAVHFGLSDQDLKERRPGGKQTTFYNRASWARTYLAKAGLLEITRRSVYRITDRGQAVLKSEPARLDAKYLARFPEFVAFRRGKNRAAAEQEARDKKAQEILDFVAQWR